MKSIYVVLTRTNTILSNIIRFVMKDDYTHASISLDKNFKTMYSFGRKNVYNPFVGRFIKENFNEGVYGLHDYLQGIVMEIKVTNKQHNKAYRLLNDFEKNKNSYKYNYMGLLNSLLNKESYNENRFLCSEFVYYILNKSEIADFNKPQNLVRPQDLLNLNGKVIFKGNLKDINTSIKYSLQEKIFPHPRNCGKMEVDSRTTAFGFLQADKAAI